MKAVAFLIIFAVYISSQAQRVRRTRRCARGPVDIGSVTAINLETTFTPIFPATSNNSNLFLTMSLKWEIDNRNNVSFDGLLIRIIGSDRGVTEHTIPPINQCVAEENAFWLNTNCSESVNTLCPEGTDDDTMNEACLCPASNCSVIDSINCRGTSFYLTEHGGSYLSFKSDVRELLILANFHINYQINIIPYYRQFVGSSSSLVQTAADCHEIVMRSRNVSFSEAVSICCDFGIPHFKPLLLQISEVKINESTGLADVTILWFPPIFQVEPVLFGVFPSLDSVIALNAMFPEVRSQSRFTPSSFPEALQIPCYNRTSAFQATVSNVSLTTNFTLVVRSIFSLQTNHLFCSNPISCEARLTVTPEDISRCLNEPSLCGGNTLTPTTKPMTSSRSDICLEKPSSSLQSKLLPILTLIPNFDTSTVSANITWIPPQTPTDSFSLLIAEVNENTLEASTTATHEPIIRIEKPTSDFQLQCFGTSHGFQTILNNLSIDRDYVIQVISVYNGSHASLCASAPENCRSDYQLSLKNKDYCELQYRPCASHETCSKTLENGRIKYSCNFAVRNRSSAIFVVLFQLIIIYFMEALF